MAGNRNPSKSKPLPENDRICRKSDTISGRDSSERSHIGSADPLVELDRCSDLSSDEVESYTGAGRSQPKPVVMLHRIKEEPAESIREDPPHILYTLIIKVEHGEPTPSLAEGNEEGEDIEGGISGYLPQSPHISAQIKDEEPSLFIKSKNVSNSPRVTKNLVPLVPKLERVCAPDLITQSGNIVRASNDSQPIKLQNVSVRIEDLFTAEVRKLGNAHTNSVQCACKYCCKSSESAPAARCQPRDSTEKGLVEHNESALSFQNVPGRKVSGSLPYENSFISESGIGSRGSAVASRAKKLPVRGEAPVKSPTLTSNDERRQKLNDCSTTSERGSQSILRTKGHCKSKLSSKTKDTLKGKIPVLRDGKPFRCNDCNSSFKFKSVMKLHMNIKHSDGKPFHCKDCDLSFKLKSALKKHQTVHSDERPFRCSECNSSFKWQIALKSHMSVHSDEKPFHCNDCNLSFKRKGDIRSHVLIHSDKEPFRCVECTSSFKRENDLKKHMLVHSDEKPFRCSECTLSFKRKSDIRKHAQVHSDGRPFLCNDCNLSFKRKDDLRSHVLIHSDNKPFRCGECSLSFKRENDLKKHMSVHSAERPVRCNVCNLSFKREGNLRAHALIHSDQRPFRCNDCNSCFKSKHALRTHILIHSSEKPFRCENCNSCFKRKGDLRTHVLIHSR